MKKQKDVELSGIVIYETTTNQKFPQLSDYEKQKLIKLAKEVNELLLKRVY